MRLTSASILGCALATVALSGCHVTVRDTYYDPPARTTYVEEVHVHDASCGHFWNGTVWISAGHGHHHHEGCGHYWNGSRWCNEGERRVIVAEPPRATVVVEREHACHDGCGHYWDGGRWVVVERHVHGPGCGHVIVNGYWVLRVR